jgi:hypothetical protein
MKRHEPNPLLAVIVGTAGLVWFISMRDWLLTAFIAPVIVIALLMLWRRRV